MTPQTQFNLDVAALCTRMEQTQPCSPTLLGDGFLPERRFPFPFTLQISFAVKHVALDLCSWSLTCELRIPPQGLQWKAHGSPGCWQRGDAPPRRPSFMGPAAPWALMGASGSLQASTTLIVGITMIFQQRDSGNGFPPTQHCWCGFFDVL